MRTMIDQLVSAALAAAAPRAAVLRCWPGDLAGPVHVLATGKASLEMAAAACERLGAAGGPAAGLVTAMPERVGLVALPPTVRVLEADHPLPTERNVAAARAVLDFVAAVPPEGMLLVLLSGGGSAHLTLPAGDLTLEDLREVTRGLQRAGATIDDLNAVRKHVERLKGGRLAAACPAARLVGLVMSDVEGDRLDVIASGPCAGDPTTYGDALKVLEQFGLAALRPRLTQHLREGAEGRRRETLKPGDKALAKVSHRVIASNQTVKDALAEEARQAGFFVTRDHRFISGGAAAEGRRLGGTLRRHIAAGQRTCFIAGGEPVVNVGEARGHGGPSQELALAAAVELDGAEGVALAALSTDGVDGPPGPTPETTHAGAVVTGETAHRGRQAGRDPVASLDLHDSATFFSKLGDAIRTGPTGTNLNHVVVGVLTPPKR